MKTSLFYKGLFFLICAQALVGLNIVCSKYLVSDLSVIFLLTIRFLLAALILLPLHWLTAARRLPLSLHLKNMTRGDWFFFIAQGLSAGLIFNCFMLTGLHYTDANIAGIITSTLPAIIAMMSWAMLGIKINAKQALCILFAMLGLVIIALSKVGPKNTHSFVGDTLIFLSLIPEAAYYVFGKMYTVKLPVFLFSSLINWINVLILFPVWLILEKPQAITVEQFLLLLVLGLSTGLFYVLLYYGSKWVDNVLTSLTTAVMPIATVFFAWIFLGEQLHSTELAGMALVIFSILLYARR